MTSHRLTDADVRMLQALVPSNDVGEIRRKRLRLELAKMAENLRAVPYERPEPPHAPYDLAAHHDVIQVHREACRSLAERLEELIDARAPDHLIESATDSLIVARLRFELVQMRERLTGAAGIDNAAEQITREPAAE